MIWRLVQPGAEILSEASQFLEKNEAEYSLLLMNLEGMQGKRSLPKGAKPFFAILEENHEITGIASFISRNLLLSHFPKHAVAELVMLVAQESVNPPGVVGAFDSVDEFVKHWCATRDAKVSARVGQGIYRLDQVIPPPPVPGRMHVIGEADIALIADWIGAFHQDAIPFEAAPSLEERLKDAHARVKSADVFVWKVDGNPVGCAALARPSPNGITVNFVYTPPHARRKGYATALVAKVSELALSRGKKFCTLYTDLGNPTSNSIYMKIGYRRIGDSLVCRFKTGK